jgi:hypothetical protein
MNALEWKILKTHDSLFESDEERIPQPLGSALVNVA